jgi:RNA polymerase sigma-70 factor, ECF subfamily
LGPGLRLSCRRRLRRRPSRGRQTISGVVVDDNEELAGLLNEARKGDQQALGALLVRLRGWVRGWAQGQLGQRLLARLDGSDIVQDVHLRALERFDQFRGDSVPQLRAWVAEILKNVVIDCFRRQRAGGRDPDLEVAGGDLFRGLAADATTPSQGAMRNEQQARLSEALHRLPEKQQLVFSLRLYEGLPFEEVARRVGVTVGNARVLMVRATERLSRSFPDGRPWGLGCDSIG